MFVIIKDKIEDFKKRFLIIWYKDDNKTIRIKKCKKCVNSIFNMALETKIVTILSYNFFTKIVLSTSYTYSLRFFDQEVKKLIWYNNANK